MNMMDQFVSQMDRVEEARAAATRAVGPWKIGPTRRGGQYLSRGDKHLYDDISVSDLRDLRSLIDDFLLHVLEESIS